MSHGVDKRSQASKRPGAERLDVVTELAEMHQDTIIWKRAVAKMFRRSVRTIERKVARGELPPPFRFMGGAAWTVGSIREHIEQLQAQAVAEAEAEQKRLGQYSILRG
jgi:predicted DNA-binding transcriptional regulator AlpA